MLMPAIQLARLKIQITELLTFFGDPPNFLRELHNLFDFYADRTRHPGQSGKPKPLIQAYNVPRQVIRRIESDLTPMVLEDPETALILADQLWIDAWYECRILAISILGLLPLDPAEFIVERLQDWGKNCPEDALLDALLDIGAAHLREKSPDAFLALVESWLSENDISSRKIGLRALPALILNPEFENLPFVYRLLSPYLRGVTSMLETDLLLAVRALGERSPQETSYFLQQIMAGPYQSGLTIIVRRSLDVFPGDQQDSLRAILREQMR
jgi:hypothetical protein